jgi:hypothetical protein
MSAYVHRCLEAPQWDFLMGLLFTTEICTQKRDAKVKCFYLGVKRFYLGVKSFYLGVKRFYLGVKSFYLGVKSFYLGVKSFYLGVKSFYLCRCKRILTFP